MFAGTYYFMNTQVDHVAVHSDSGLVGGGDTRGTPTTINTHAHE